MSHATNLDGEALEQAMENSLQPIPSWIKLGIVGLAVLLVLVFVWIIYKASDDRPPSMVDIEHSSTELDQANAINDTILKPAIPVQPLIEMGVVPETNTVTATILPDFTPEVLSEQLEKLHIELTEIVSKQAVRQKQQDAQIIELQERVLAHAQKIEQFEQRLRNQNKPKAKSKPKRIRQSAAKTFSSKKPLSKQVPFVLVNIDQWGDDTYAILRHKGQLYEKTSGQSLSGWRILEINRTNDTVSVQDPAGRQQWLQSQITPNR